MFHISNFKALTFYLHQDFLILFLARQVFSVMLPSFVLVMDMYFLRFYVFHSNFHRFLHDFYVFTLLVFAYFLFHPFLFLQVLRWEQLLNCLAEMLIFEQKPLTPHDEVSKRFLGNAWVLIDSIISVQIIGTVLYIYLATYFI